MATILFSFGNTPFLWMIETIGRWELVKGEVERLLVWGGERVEREREEMQFD